MLLLEIALSGMGSFQAGVPTEENGLMWIGFPLVTTKLKLYAVKLRKNMDDSFAGAAATKSGSVGAVRWK